MLGWIILLFVVMPFVELFVLIQIGQYLGVWPTLFIVFGTGVLGGVLARWQGASAWRDVVGALRAGRVPSVELGAGALFLVGAALLLTPGVITDVFGFVMMVPWARRGLARFVIRRAKASDRVHVSVGGFGSLGRSEGTGRGEHDLETTGYAKEDEPVDEDEERLEE